MQSMTDKIQNLIAGFENYGYVVSAEPVPGEEEGFCQHLRDGLARLEATFDRNAKDLGLRGKSRRALEILHREMPEPAWGIEVRDAEPVRGFSAR